MAPIWWSSKSRRFAVIFCSTGIVLSVALLMAGGAKLVTLCTSVSFCVSLWLIVSSRINHRDTEVHREIPVEYQGANDFSEGLALVTR
jgi:hypothetical protein